MDSPRLSRLQYCIRRRRVEVNKFQSAPGYPLRKQPRHPCRQRWVSRGLGRGVSLAGIFHLLPGFQSGRCAPRLMGIHALPPIGPLIIIFFCGALQAFWNFPWGGRLEGKQTQGTIHLETAPTSAQHALILYKHLPPAACLRTERRKFIIHEPLPPGARVMRAHPGEGWGLLPTRPS